MSCDVVVPIHNGLHVAEPCLRSVLEHTAAPHRVIVVDDASDPHVAGWLDAFAATRPDLRLLRNEANRGYLESANRGIAASEAPYVCLLNSDTIVTPGWLDRLLRCAESDPRILLVNPVSNAAANLSVPFGPGQDVFSMADAIAAASRRTFPDVVTAVGFCLLLKRAALDRFGAFDPVYGHGYCEESDYCMRVMEAGFRVVVADDAFVYHRGGGSFVDGRERYLANRRIFDARWGPRYEERYRAFCRRDPLRYLRDALTRDLEDAPPPPAATGAPYGALETLAVMTADAWRQGGLRGLARKLPVVPLRLRDAVRRLRRGDSGSVQPQAQGLAEGPAATRPLFATAAYSERLRPTRGLAIAVLVHRFELCGGVLAVVDLINGLVLAGHRVIPVTVGEDPPPGRFPLLARPLAFRDVHALAQGFPAADLVVATFWPTAADWLPRVRDRRPDLPAVYFVQDDEAEFYPASDVGTRRRVVTSYGHADARIVTSRWLQERLAGHGADATVVPVGIDLHAFYPRPRAPRGERQQVLVQARPWAPWRGFRQAVEVFERLAGRRRDVEAVFFGCGDDELASFRLSFPHRNVGRVHDRATVARLYASCDVVYDPSRFQAFGLPGLEAMACGVPAVLPDRGGLLDYAVHEANALLTPPEDVEVQAAAIERALDDALLRERLVASGLETASRFGLPAMVGGHLEVYRAIAARR